MTPDLLNPKNVESFVTRLLKEHGLFKWSFAWNNRKRSYGVCNYTRRQIQLSRIPYRTMTHEDVLEVILHELAHALTPGANHGPVWKRKARELGITPTRCKEPSEETRDHIRQLAKWEVSCGSCGKSGRFHREPTSYVKPNVTCRCGGRFSLRQLR